MEQLTQQNGNLGLMSYAPVTDTEMQLRSKSDQLIQAAERAVIDSPESAEKGVKLAKMIRATIKKLDEERLTYTKPFRDAIDAVNSRVAMFTTPLKQKAQVMIDGKLLNYQRAEQEKARKAAEEARQAAAAALPPAFEDEPLPPAPELPRPSKPIRSDFGSASMITKFDFKVVDIKAVPADLLCVDGVETRKRINCPNRVKDIPGLEIFEVEHLAVR